MQILNHMQIKKTVYHQINKFGRLCAAFMEVCACFLFKAALIKICIFPKEKMTTFNVKGVARSDKPTENYCPNLQFPSTLLSILASFRKFFGFTARKFSVLVQSHRPHQRCLQQQQAATSSEKTDKPTLHYLPSSK